MAWPKGVKRGPNNRPQNESATVSRETNPEQELPENISNPPLRSESTSRPREVYKVAKPAAPKSKSWTMRAGNNWDSAVSADESPDRYHIPRHMFPEDMDLFWATRTVHGQEMTQRLNGFYRSGWTPVHKDDFDGRFATMFETDSSGYVVQEASILCARPEAMSIKARARDKAKAEEQIALKSQAFTGGQIGATGADHPSAVGTNRINRTMERLEIPKD